MNASNDVRLAVVGLGKMGLSHFAIANATDGIDVVAVSDSSKLVSQGFQRFIKVKTYSDYEKLLDAEELDAVMIAVPTRYHFDMAKTALDRGINVFCEKPLTLSGAESDALSVLAAERGLVGQVGYHNRFVATFGEAQRLIAAGAIGRVRHVQAEAYGPVVLKPAAETWRSSPEQGGGCLYDYAAHPINLMNWYVGRPTDCVGADLTHQYSAGVEDAVYADLRFANGVSGQVSVNWSDDSVRKMTTKLSIWGDGGRISVDRQELQLFTNGKAPIPEGYNEGWTVRYITDLTPNVGYYLRGEEYSAQVESFMQAIKAGNTAPVNDFASAAATDFTMEMIRKRFVEGPQVVDAGAPPAPPQRGLLSRVLGR